MRDKGFDVGSRDATQKDSRARAEEALRLRAKRMTWAAISAELGFQHRSGARLAVERLIGRRSANPMTKLTERAVSAESLRVQEQGLQPLFDAAVERRDEEAAVLVSKELRSLVSDRAKISGIAAPQAVDVNLSVGEIIAQTRQRLLSVIDAEVVDIREIER